MSRAKSPTLKRIMREAAEIENAPSPDYTARPLESDLFEWHFTMRGPPNSPYGEGVYHGRIVLPPTYPLRPPSFRFTTPNGRFEANREICLSISGHHEETWQPAWGVRTAIVAFMVTDARGQVGGYDTTEAVRKRLAGESRSFKCATCGETNEDIIKASEERAKEMETGAEEVEVPEELNLGFKDEMEAKKNKQQAEEDSETAELAEGFVQTVPTPPTGAVEATPMAAVSADNDAQAAAPQPAARNAPQPTPTVPQTARPPTMPIEARRSADAGVPVWIDRLIVALVVLLAALVLKVLFGA